MRGAWKLVIEGRSEERYLPVVEASRLKECAVQLVVAEMLNGSVSVDDSYVRNWNEPDEEMVPVPAGIFHPWVEHPIERQLRYRVHISSGGGTDVLIGIGPYLEAEAG